MLAEADQIGTVKTFLDLGCGSGEMSILMAERGTRCKGIDFAEEMIEIATRTANENNVGDLCTFETGSVLEIDLANEPYDMVAALGLIEYLSIEDTKNLFKRVNDCLKDKGALAVQVRNRLFNLTTFNDYTRSEIEKGDFNRLMDEGLAIAGATGQEDLMKQLELLDQGPTQQSSAPPAGGIPVSTRHQYTPAQLYHTLKACGYEPYSVRPYHYHVAPPAFLSQHEDIHAHTAPILQEYSGSEPSLIPQSSTFVINARKI